MQLVIKRAKKGVSKSKYSLYVRADIADEEKALIKQNSLGKENLVYHNKSGVGASAAAFSFWAALWRMLKDTRMTVDTFVRGTTFTCKDVTELVDIERQAIEAAISLRNILEMARTFGGENVVTVDEEFIDRYYTNKQRTRA